MSVAVVVITHGNAGAELLATAERFVGKLEGVRFVRCETGEESKSVEHHIEDALADLGTRDALFLVDLYGSTPARLCCSRCQGSSVVVAGVNLAMLMKLATVDRNQDAHALAEELAASGAKAIQVYHRPGVTTRATILHEAMPPTTPGEQETR